MSDLNNVTQERRLAAILSADVVGYSRLMHRDEDGTLERIRLLRRELIDPIINQYSGRIVKLMGDGLLLEFASVVDSVRTAIDVQEAMARRNRLTFERLSLIMPPVSRV